MNPNALFNSISKPNRLFLFSGPCVIETEVLCLKIARTLKRSCNAIGINYVFKASFDKANRTSAKAKRGPGIEAGLSILRTVRDKVGVPVLTDVHTEQQAEQAAEVVDVLQIPAFLCRQTDLITTAANTGKIVNLKKGQFLSPKEMGQVAAKAAHTGNRKIILTERGSSFGYNNLVADMRSIPIMQSFGYPVVFDATHSVQLPGGGGDRSSGQDEFAPILAKSAIAAGANGLFIETHPEPAISPSDGGNMIPLAQMNATLKRLFKVFGAVH
jgi:2-dehydro-3-deoxyphosphooctonate aldolase (KDO 8-P synthase)